MKKIKETTKLKPNAIYGSLERKAHSDALQKQFDEYMRMEYILAREQMAQELLEQFKDMTKDEIIEFLEQWTIWEN